MEPIAVVCQKRYDNIKNLTNLAAAVETNPQARYSLKYKVDELWIKNNPWNGGRRSFAARDRGTKTGRCADLLRSLCPCV